MSKNLRQKRREDLRQKREKARQAEERQKKIKVGIISAGLALLSIGFVVGAILFQTRGEGTSRSNQEIEKLLGGLEQEGTILGNPSARRTLIEWGDMQCPACAAFAKGDFVDIVKEGVRPGLLKIEFRQWPILGPDSSLAAKAALAASLQGRYWQFIEYFYANQGSEGSGYVNDDFLEDVARQAGVKDIEKWQQDRELPKWEEELLKNDEEAIKYSLQGTPSFAIKENGRTVPTQNAKDALDNLKGD